MSGLKSWRANRIEDGNKLTKVRKQRGPSQHSRTSKRFTSICDCVGDLKMEKVQQSVVVLSGKER